MSPHDREAIRWLREVYQGDTVPQLTLRAVVTGMLIGSVMSVINLYVSLKTAWGVATTIMSCIIAYAVFRSLGAMIPRIRRKPFTILENYTMSSAASAAGYMNSAGLISAIPAYFFITGHHFVWWQLMPWMWVIAVLGIFMAVPVKRQLINNEQLPFPTGIATAETLRSLHSSGLEGMKKARALFGAGLFAALFALWRDGLPRLAAWAGAKLGNPGLPDTLGKFAVPDTLPLFPGAVGNRLRDQQTWGFDCSFLLYAAGAIMGIRIATSLLIGAILFFGILAPLLFQSGQITALGWRPITAWTLWPATVLMVSSGLTSFALQWPTIVRAIKGLGAVFESRGGKKDPLAHIEVPARWYLGGILVFGTAAVLLGHAFFGITWWMGIIAVAITFILSVVAARATGETDITPVGPMGKITQLIFGGLDPGNVTTNLMAASVTAGASTHTADLLTDLKSGYLLGGNSRRQTISQLFGSVAGMLCCVPVYEVIARSGLLGSDTLPAPAARVWEGVARLLSNGIGSLPASALWAMGVAALLGIALTLLPRFLPENRRHLVPSPMAMGIGGVVPASNCVSMFIGGLAAWLWSRRNQERATRYIIPAASGLIAGEALMAVVIILFAVAPELLRNVFGS
jgi:uncharacterized oligopeptide transporter (OPT) family protein